jgi:hypothetical protein
VNSAKLFSENSQTKTCAHEECCHCGFALRGQTNVQHSWVLSVALGAQRARVDSREFRAKIQEQSGVIDPCDDHHQRAGGRVSGSRYTLPDVEPNEEVSAAPIQTSLQAILVLGRSLKIIANRTVIESRERRK